jgi:hypothetical protein
MEFRIADTFQQILERLSGEDHPPGALPRGRGQERCLPLTFLQSWDSSVKNLSGSADITHRCPRRSWTRSPRWIASADGLAQFACRLNHSYS